MNHTIESEWALEAAPVMIEYYLTKHVSYLPGEDMARLAAPALAEWLGLELDTP